MSSRLWRSGASGLRVHGGRDEKNLAAALDSVCASLAKQIVSDGEGVSHVVELRVEGARTEAEAERIARSIANSPLVKTAWAGSDPNWGRILAAVGNSGVPIDPSYSGHFEWLYLPEIDLDILWNERRIVITKWHPPFPVYVEAFEPSIRGHEFGCSGGEWVVE